MLCCWQLAAASNHWFIAPWNYSIFVVYVRPAIPSLLAMVKFCTLDVAIAPTSTSIAGKRA